MKQTERAGEGKLQETVTRLEEKRDEYSARLDDGLIKIEEAKSQGKNTEQWESHWIKLLREYEAICTNLRQLWS